MRSFVCRRRNSLVIGLFALTLASLLIACLSRSQSGERRPSVVAVAAAASTATQPNQQASLSSYLNSARALLSSSLEAHEQARNYNSLMPNEDPRTAAMLRDTIDKTSDLISDYQHEGLSNMPPLPNVPVLNTIMRLPDKLLRAELSMLQDGIRMAQEMRARPITATVNTPRELSNMFLRMIQQLNQ